VRSVPRHAVAALLALGALAGVSAAAGAQSVQPEARVDAIIARRSTIQGALGAAIRVSPELRLELAVGAGPSFGGGPATSLGARGDAVVHFLLDPRHAMRWSPYAGGGIGARYDGSAAREWRAVAIVAIGVDGPRWKHVIPFIEAGLGGGLRLGVGARR
jgi:hypothetical protein